MKVKLRIHKREAALYEGIFDVSDADSFGRAWLTCGTSCESGGLQERPASVRFSTNSTNDCSMNWMGRRSAFR